MPYGRMTVRELAKRLAEIVEHNDKAGWSDRNDLPVAVRVRRVGAKRRVQDHFYTAVCHADSCQVGLGEHGDFCGVMTVEESNLLKL